MAPPLYLSTLVTGSIFFILLLVMRHNKKSPITAVFSGGTFWFIAAIIQIILLLLIYLVEPQFEIGLYSDVSSYIVAVKEYRTVLFWYLVFSTLFTEFMRYLGSQSENFSRKSIENYTLFGVGWGIAEFCTRFVGFFNEDVPTIYYVFIFLMILVMNIFLSALMIRVSENTKFAMFTAFNKFFFELGLFGIVGYETPLPGDFFTLWLIIFFSVLILSLSIYTRNYEFED